MLCAEHTILNPTQMGTQRGRFKMRLRWQVSPERTTTSRKTVRAALPILVMVAAVTWSTTFINSRASAQSPPASSQQYLPSTTRPDANLDDNRPTAAAVRWQNNLGPAPAPVDPNQERTAAVILVKNALIAVNQGNLTGNFTVLRDLSSPGFRERNSAGELATIFQNIRQQKIDLSPIVVLDPVMSQPRLTADGQLFLEGYFASQPKRINFRLAFIKDQKSGGWMIETVSVGLVSVDASLAEQAAQRANPYR